LADLLAIGVGSPARVLAALAAVLLTLGTMNAYYAGSAKLGAALGRDGALPGWLAAGSEAGEVPRRSLAVVAGSGAVALAAVTAAGVGVRPLVLLTTGCFVLVYALGTAAAIRLLPKGSAARRMAFVALLAVAALLAATGVYLLWPLVLAGVALGYLRIAGARRRGASMRRPEGGQPSPSNSGIRTHSGASTASASSASAASSATPTSPL
jgi:amino acid efflux transporter